MLVAIDQRGQTVNLLEKPEVKKGDYFCPACSGRVRYRSGKILRSHFAHQTLRDCDFWSENESAQHLELKTILYDWLRKQEVVKLEVPLPQIQQVADLLVNQNIALEVQCSRLSISRLQERTKAYQQAGMAVLWLLGKNLWLGERLTNLHKQFLYFSMNMGFHLWELDADKEELRLHYLIHEDWQGKVHKLTKVFPFGQGDLLAILRLPFAKQTMSHFTCPMDMDLLNYVAKQLYYRVPKWMNLQAEAYQQGKNLLSQSLDDFYPQIRLPRSAIGFAQIRQDLSSLYPAFDQHYESVKNKRQQVVFPPVIYYNN
ncbi:competence protein CoiA [Streptococcus suis]|uniref:competence protein CoiA n=1 Tax=Streptococcus suis TaxID=1307 RepID=UPI001ABED13C|nr:competence protein CoiA [Streptococcus suis]